MQILIRLNGGIQVPATALGFKLLCGLVQGFNSEGPRFLFLGWRLGIKVHSGYHHCSYCLLKDVKGTCITHNLNKIYEVAQSFPLYKNI